MATTTNALSTTAASNATSYTSGSFTPAASDYLFVVVHATDTAVAGTMSDSQGLSWSNLMSVASNTSNIVNVFYSTTTTSAAAMTVTWDCSADGATGAIISILRIGGSNGRIRQFASKSGPSSETPNVVFDTACRTANPVIFTQCNLSAPHGMTAPASHIARNANQVSSAPTIGLSTSSRSSGETTDTTTAGGASPTDWTAIGVEWYDDTDYDVVLSGVGVTNAIGSIGLSNSVSASGQSLSVSRGSVIGNLSKAISGQSATSTQGSISSARSSSISGHSLAIARGSITAANSFVITGQQLSAGIGTITAGSGETVVALVGVSVNAASGSLAASFDRALSGQSLSASIGDLVSGNELPITGLGASVGGGSLLTNIEITLSGVDSYSAIGDIAGSMSVGISGVGSSFSIGSIVAYTPGLSTVKAGTISATYAQPVIIATYVQPTLTATYTVPTIEAEI